MLTLTILFSILCSACFSQLLTCPKTLNIPIGRCRKINCTFSNQTEDASIVFSGYPEDLIEIYGEIEKQYTACAVKKDGPLGLYNLTYNMLSDNATLSEPQTGVIAINIEKPIVNSSLSPIIWQNSKVKGTCAAFDVVTPQDNGNIYYSVIGVWAEPQLIIESVDENYVNRLSYQSLQNRLEQCKQYDGACESSMLVVYPRPGIRESYDTIIGNKRVTAKQSTIIVRNDLIEGTHYNICAFYRTNKTNDSTATSCQLFNTDTSQNMLRARFKFTQNISQQKYNTFLCFLTKYLGAQTRDVITIEGYSCNKSEPQVAQIYYHLDYDSQNNGNQTIVYVSLGCAEAENKILEPNFNKIWDNNGNISPLFRWVLIQNNMTWVKSATNLGEKNMGELLKPKDINARFNTEVSKKIQGDETYISYKVYNITSESPGSVYFVFITYNLGLDVDPSIIPTVNQTISCPYFVSTSGNRCKRVVLTGTVSQPPHIEFSVSDRHQTSQYLYKLFYVEAGQYPKIPIASWRKVKEVNFEEEKIQDLRVNMQPNGKR